MRRFLIAALLALVPSLGLGAVRTANTDGLWTATATWSGAAEPTAADECTINAGVEVIMNDAASVCGELTVNGSLIFREGARTLVIGDGATATHDDFITIADGGEIMMFANNVLEIDTDRGGSGSATIGRIQNSGSLVASGDVVRQKGTITGFSEVSGTHPNQQITLTDDTYRQSVAAEFDGMVLIPTTGAFRWQWFDIGTTTDLNEILVDINDRGAVDSRNSDAVRLNPTTWAEGDWGEIISTGTIQITGGTTVDLTGHTVTAAQVVGSSFICNDDLNVADDPDFATIASWTDSTTFELESAYGGAACAGATELYRIYDFNQPPNEAVVVESFSVGDEYIIIDPAVISIPSGSQSDTAQTNNLNFVLNDGSLTSFYATEIGFCGQQVSGGSVIDCLDVNQIDNSQADEGFYMDLTEVHHPSGQYVIDLVDAQNITMKRFTLRDTAGGADPAASNNGHGISVADPSGGGRSQNLVFEDCRVNRLNDDNFSWTVQAEAADDYICQSCTVRRCVIGFSPVHTGTSVQAFEPDNAVKDLVFENNFVTNIDSGVVLDSTNTTDAVDGVIRHNIIQNIQVAGAVATGGAIEGSDLADANQNIAVVDNILRNFNGALVRGRYYYNYIDPQHGAGLTQVMSFPQYLAGNVLIEPPQLAANLRFLHHSPTGSNTLSPATLTVTDNVYIGTTDHINGLIYGYHFGETGVSSDIVFHHNTTYCYEHRATAASGDAAGIVIRGPAGSTQDIKYNIFADCFRGVRSQSGSPTITLDYNLFWTVPTPCSACSTGANDITVGGMLGFRSLPNQDLTVLPGSEANENLGDDGFLRGARIAGVDFSTFKELYPYIGDKPRINNIAGVDLDGDGVFDLHDNCDRHWNPAQLDADSDGIGDVCD